MKFLSRSTSLFLLFNWGMAMTSEVYPVGPGDRTGADFIGAVVQIPKELIPPKVSSILSSQFRRNSSYSSSHPFRRNSFIHSRREFIPDEVSHPFCPFPSNPAGSILFIQPSVPKELIHPCRQAIIQPSSHPWRSHSHPPIPRPRRHPSRSESSLPKAIIHSRREFIHPEGIHPSRNEFAPSPSPK